MIAAQRDGAALHKPHHAVDDEAGIGAVAHIVAEENKIADRAALRMREARLERLAVGVDVGEDRGAHAGSSRRMMACP